MYTYQSDVAVQLAARCFTEYGHDALTNYSHFLRSNTARKKIFTKVTLSNGHNCKEASLHLLLTMEADPASEKLFEEAQNSWQYPQ